jgi:hypothetical protein
MFDIFYSGPKPNLFAHEQAADSIAHAQSLSGTRYFWWINYLTDYTGWDFLWEPVPWQQEFRHAWPSQWQPDAGTYLIPSGGFKETKYHTAPELIRLPAEQNWQIPNNCDTESFDFSWHPDPADPPFLYQFGTQHQRTGGPQYNNGSTELKFVDQIKITSGPCASTVYIVDHLDGNIDQIREQLANKDLIDSKTVRYFDNYLDTLKRIARTATDEYVWIINSVCDYANFDFTWHPEHWQAMMLHVFASDLNKFGDTFFMHVPSFRSRADQFELLDWYDLNFVGISVPRWPLPIIEHNNDSQLTAVKNKEFAGPLAIFTNNSNNDFNYIPAVSLWREKTKTIVPLSAGASTVVVPRTAIPYIKQQLYDYPYIDRTQRHLFDDAPLDIVFIDNGEPTAENNWQALALSTATSTNRIHRSSGVNGRVAAYQAAAQLSTTPWFFAVFAKLQVQSDFDWLWQPDRMQEPKHYIFHAHNTVNGLVYGHQAMIAYNRQLVLTNTAPGLDFTLDQAHEVVPVVSGVASYHSTAWMAWRTAFRECIKLRDSLPDVENEHRLNTWLTQDNTLGQWSLKGAEDAVEYYAAVSGDFAELRKSYDWAWLASYALIKRNLTPNQ